MDALTGNPKPTELRRSCVFCRQRKMRCSGDLPCCTTCRQREKPCVYEPVAFKGRYAAAAAAAATVASSQQQKNASSFGLSRPVEYGVDPNNFHEYGGAEHLDRSGIPTHLQHQNNIPPPTMEGNLVGDELTFLFGTFFAMSQQSALVHNAIQRSNNGSGALPAFSVPLTYVDALPIITFDLIKLTMARLNAVNAENGLGDHSSLPYVQSLITDRSMTVIDGLDNPEAEQWFGVHGPPSSNQVEHLLEMAFNHHPLVALIVPKTPFIRDHHEGQSNYCLLWLLCSEGIELGLPTVGIKLSTPLAFNLPSSASFLQLAWKQLFNSHQNVPAERFWISQALLLLGFRLLCHGHVKQATAFLLLCVRCIARVVTDRSRNPALEVKINGIRMTEVEEQAINNVFWISHALLLWIWSQVDQADGDLARFICPDPHVLFTAITAAKIPSTALCADAIYKLDYVSANFTSLNMHTANARTLTVLAHVCNMVHTLINNGTGHSVQSSSSSAVFYNQAFSQFGEHHDTAGHMSTDDQGTGSSIADYAGSTMYAAVSAKLLHQTKQTLAATLHPHLSDKYTDKSILCAAYLFAICLCEPSNLSNTFSASQSPQMAHIPSQQKELAHRFRAAMDIASGMIRDCKDDGLVFHQLAPPKERILIQSLFGRASKVLARIFAHLKQNATEVTSNSEGESHNDQNENIFDTGLSLQEITSTINLIDDHANKREFPLCMTSFDTTYRTGSLFNSSKVDSLDDIAAIARSIISPKAGANEVSPINIQRMNSDTAIVADHYSRGSDVHRKASMVSTSISNDDSHSIDAATWQAQETQRARSFSDSAAIYSTTSHAAHMPGNMTFVQPPSYPTMFHNMPPPPPPTFTSFTTAMNAAVTGQELASPNQIDPKSTNDAAQSGGGGLRRLRTYSINEVRSDASFPSSFPSSVSGGQFPPSPPQSAPPSHLALLSDTSATLQAMLQDYNNNSSTAPSSSIPSANSNQATNMTNYTNQNQATNMTNYTNQNQLQNSQHHHYHYDHQNTLIHHNNGGEGSSNGSNENLAATRTATWAANSGGGTMNPNSSTSSSTFSNDVKMPFH